MPRIFWTIAKKKRLLKYADELTLEKLSRKFRQPEKEIARMLVELAPGKVPKVKIYYDRVCGQRVKITVYSERMAFGAYVHRHFTTEGVPPRH